MKSSKPLVKGEVAQLKNALQKIRAIIPVGHPDFPNLHEAEILEIADKVLGYERAYHTHVEYLLPEIKW